MPRDRRLYMTFPNNFWQHPKVMPLSDRAFRAFVEMNGYSRMNDLDGRIPAKVAGMMWSAEALEELVGSHPDRPLVVEGEGEYILREYAEHQMTVAAVEELRRARSRSGRRGAAVRWEGREHSEADPEGGEASEHGKPVASAMANGSQADGKPITEYRDRDQLASKEASGGPRKELRGTRIQEPFNVTPEMVQWARDRCPLVDGQRSTERFTNYFAAKSGREAIKIDWVRTWKNWLLKDQEEAERRRALEGSYEQRRSESNKALVDHFREGAGYDQEASGGIAEIRALGSW